MGQTNLYRFYTLQDDILATVASLNYIGWKFQTVRLNRYNTVQSPDSLVHQNETPTSSLHIRGIYQ